MSFLTELNDVWILRDGQMAAQGDADAIDSLLTTKLVELRKEDWELWDLVFPQSEMQGGGPRRLRRLAHNDPDKWKPYPG